MATQACAEYAKAAQTQGKKWQKAIQFEKEQRIKLEKMVEELAQQHRKLEEAAAASANQQHQSGKEVVFQSSSGPLLDICKTRDEVAMYILFPYLVQASRLKLV